GLERRLALRRAEVEGLAPELGMTTVRPDGHGHSADRVRRRRGPCGNVGGPVVVIVFHVVPTFHPVDSCLGPPTVGGSRQFTDGRLSPAVPCRAAPPRAAASRSRGRGRAPPRLPARRRRWPPRLRNARAGSSPG